MPLKPLLGALLLALAMLPPAARAAGPDFNAGEAAYTAGDFEGAARHFSALAEQGHVLAQYNLALLYEEGQGIERDYGKAREWYRRAAAQGNVDARYALGQMHLKGLGAPQDLVQAHLWFDLAGRPPHPHRLAAEARAKVAKQMTAAELDTARRLAQEWGQPARVLTGALQP